MSVFNFQCVHIFSVFNFILQRVDELLICYARAHNQVGLPTYRCTVYVCAHERARRRAKLIKRA